MTVSLAMTRSAGSLTVAYSFENRCKSAESLEEYEWDKIVDVDLKGYFNCAQLAARQMLEQETGGSIIMTSSIASVVGIHGLVAYSAASRWCQSIGANHGS